MTKLRRVNLIVLVAGLLALLAAACATRNNDTSSMTTAPSPSNTPTSSMAVSLTASDQQFMTNAAQGGKAEVQLGVLAVQNASSSDVKNFGQRMIDDHSRVNSELMQLASSKSVILPSELKIEQQATIDRLSKLSGKEFDRAYMAEMLKDHQGDVAEFERAANQASDADLKSWIKNTLPTLREHLQMATDIAKKVGAK